MILQEANKHEYYLENTGAKCCLCGGLVYTIDSDFAYAECIDCKTQFIAED